MYIMETGYASWRPCLLADQIRFSNLGHYFYQIILNSDHRFQRSNFCYRDKQHPLVAIGVMRHISFSYF